MALGIPKEYRPSVILNGSLHGLTSFIGASIYRKPRSKGIDGAEFN